MSFEGNRRDYETRRSSSTYGRRHEGNRMEERRRGRPSRSRSGGVNFTNTRSGARTGTPSGYRGNDRSGAFTGTPSGYGGNDRSGFNTQNPNRRQDSRHRTQSGVQGGRGEGSQNYGPPGSSGPDIRRGDSLSGAGGDMPEFDDPLLRQVMEKERKRRAEEEARRAEEERLRVLGETKASAISGAEGFGAGDAAEKYRKAYQQRLADAYDAATTGVGRSILEKGYGTGDEYKALEDAKLGQEEWLHELGAEYQAKAQSEYDRWLQENTDAINALGTKEEVDAYKWTDADYDLDLTGGKAFGSEGAYDENYIPEFYEGFRKEFGEDYSDPTMPSEWGGYKKPDLTGVKSATLADNPRNPQEGPRRTIRKANPAPVSTGLNPSSRGSARYY